ncbi:MAG: uroporphyrinogen-III synthase [Nitrososphaerota archaeon]|nr:uroporphyrinogen-III synthase [Nitrososphaerota archaeon]
MSAGVVVTRSRQGNLRLSRRLARMGLRPIEVDTLEFLPPAGWGDVDRELRSLKEYDWVVFTSATGVRFVWRRMKELGVRGTALPSVAAVGPKTAAALRRRGVEVGFVPKDYLTETLAEGLPLAEGSVLLLRADIAASGLAEGLKRRGLRVTEVAAYRTVRAGDAVDGRAVAGAKAVVFASPSAVRSFCGLVPGRVLEGLKERAVAACIGPVTAAEAEREGFHNRVVPRRYTLDSLLEELGGRLKVE